MSHRAETLLCRQLGSLAPSTCRKLYLLNWCAERDLHPRWSVAALQIKSLDQSLLWGPAHENGAHAEDRTRNSGLADRHVAVTPHTHGNIPLPALAAGWLMGNPTGTAHSGLGLRTGACSNKMVASTGFAPASRGLKGRDPVLLDDKAFSRRSYDLTTNIITLSVFSSCAGKLKMRPASPFNAI